MKLQLVINIDYKMNGTTVEDVVEHLEWTAKHLALEGRLSGHLDATVSDYAVCVRELK